jgi:hypothetical protein
LSGQLLSVASSNRGYVYTYGDCDSTFWPYDHSLGGPFPQCFLALTKGSEVTVPATVDDVVRLLVPIDNERKAALRALLELGYLHLHGCGNVRRVSDGFEVAMEKGAGQDCRSSYPDLVVLHVASDGTVRTTDVLVTFDEGGFACGR